MFRKIFISCLIVATTHYFLGCAVYNTGKEFDVVKLEGKDTKITKVVMPDGFTYSFKNNGATVVLRGAGVSGYNMEGKPVFFLAEQIEEAYRTDPPATFTIEQLKSDTSILLSGLQLKNGSMMSFGKGYGQYRNANLLLKGLSDADSLVEINALDALYVMVEKFDGVMSLVATVGFLAATGMVIILIALAAKKSCPFIYSYDGDKYVFDAEPLGGAISKAFERTDYTKLENLKEVDGRYKLKITNEVYETEYIDEMSLVAVDHPENTIALMNNDGEVFALPEGEKVSYASDEKGNDLKPFLIEDDMISWQTKMPFKDNTLTKHKIKFGFKKRPGARKAWLVYNVGTTHWGSTMISEMLELQGKNLEEHYRNLDKKGEYYKTTMNFLQREELYEMNLLMKENGEWASKGILQGGGPFKTERRVLEIDLSKVNGEIVEFEVNPPVGFWTLDNFSLCFDEPGTTKATEVKVAKTVTHDGKDISSIVSKSDETYHQMPTTGDWFTAEYDAPKLKSGMARSIFMKTKGWYKIDMPALDKDPDLLTLFKLVSKPGEVIKFSNERYQKWILSVEKETERVTR